MNISKNKLKLWGHSGLDISYWIRKKDMEAIEDE